MNSHVEKIYSNIIIYFFTYLKFTRLLQFCSVYFILENELFFKINSG